MKPNKHTLATSALLAGLVLSTSASASVILHDFNSSGINHGWTGSGADTTGAGQATGIDGTSGVFTSDDVTSIDPKLNYNSGTAGATLITLGAGETWSTFTFRFRQLNGNPGAGGIASAPFSVSGTISFFNGSTNNLGVSGIGNGTVSGTGAYAGDTYQKTLTAEADNWQVYTIDLTNAPTLNSQNINSFRFDPVGNDDTKNFEVDYASFTSVPEPSIALLSCLGFGAFFLRRRIS